MQETYLLGSFSLKDKLPLYAVTYLWEVGKELSKAKS